MKVPHCRCISRYQVGSVTDIVNQQTVKFDGMPRHVKDLWLFIDSDDDLSSESDRLIELYESDDSTDAELPRTVNTLDDTS